MVMKLLRGERMISAVALLALLAVLGTGSAVLLFVLDQRQLAQQAVRSEQQLRSTIIARCTQRITYDQRFVKAAEGDKEFYAELEAIGREVPIPASTDPVIKRLYARQQAAIALAKQRKAEIVREGVIGNCDVYAPVPKV